MKSSVAIFLCIIFGIGPNTILLHKWLETIIIWLGWFRFSLLISLIISSRMWDTICHLVKCLYYFTKHFVAIRKILSARINLLISPFKLVSYELVSVIQSTIICYKANYILLTLLMHNTIVQVITSGIHMSPTHSSTHTHTHVSNYKHNEIFNNMLMFKMN